MAVSQVAFNISHAVENDVKTFMSTVRGRLEGLVGQLGAAIGSVWSGGFVGMSESGMDQLKQAITQYAQGIQDVIKGFDANGDLDEAFKGSIGDAAKQFVQAIKDLLEAYVSLIKKMRDEADEAWQNWQESGKAVSSDVESSSQDIRNQAQSIRLD